jgi:glycerol-3-phosphate dehydrogenase
MDLEVLVIGGGATGLGVAWDLALRGVRVAVAEMGGIVSGTSGRYHGQLHTGARYAVSDANSAQECWQEHQIIRRIAPMALDDTGGLFVRSASDDEAFVPQWLERCATLGIPTERVSPEEARRLEPALSPAIRQVFAVPDAACDSFALGRALRASIVATAVRCSATTGSSRCTARASGSSALTSTTCGAAGSRACAPLSP